MNKLVITEITQSQLEEIYIFIINSMCFFESLGLNNEDIKILMPYFYRHAFRTYFRRPVDMLNIREVEDFDFKFRNVEVNLHYKKEIVVYCTRFESNEIFDQPKIYPL